MSRILIVDDDPNIIELVSLYARKDGHQVLSARDGREALRIGMEERPDLMILDLMLPKLTGLEVSGKLRSQERPLPIIVGAAENALTREQLLDRVWGYDYYGETRTVDVHVSRLRGKLQASQTEIETVWGVGYKIVMK